MKQSKALKQLLTDHTTLFAGDRVEVRFDDQPHYAGPKHGGPYLAVNPDVSGWYDVDVSGANELRLLRDTLSHEAYEYRMGFPSAKEAFMRRHGDFYGGTPSPKANAAGYVYNILRDSWVNTTRCRDFPGLRRTFAFKADLLAGDHDISELDTPNALITGLQQVSLTNTANGIRDADDEVRSLLATARHYVERCRTAESHDELVALADALFTKFAPHLDEVDDDFADRVDHMAGQQAGAHVDGLSDDDLQDAIESAIENAPDDGDLPDPSDCPVDQLDDDDIDDVLDADSSGMGDALDDALDDEGDDTDAEGGAARDDADADAEADGTASGNAGDDDGLLDDMDRLDDAARPAGDVMGLDGDDDYHEPESGDETRYEQVQHNAAFAATDWADRMDRRDEYAQRSTGKGGDLPADEIQSLMRETGLAEELRRAFARIKTAEVTETTTRPTSKLNLKNVTRHMAGDYGVRDVYETTKRGATGGRTIAAVMDASGSMAGGGAIGADRMGGGGSIVDAKVVLGALHLAAHEIGDDVVATAFDTGGQDSVRLVTGPDESFEWDHLDGFTAAGNHTPTAAGVLDGVRLLERAGGKERVMVVVTDGGANRGVAGTRWAEMGTGDGAVADARMAVERAREEGITVIGVGVGNSITESKLETTFGTDSWIHVDADDLVEEVVRIYREQLDDDRVVDAF